jgi:hypothetical protein
MIMSSQGAVIAISAVFALACVSGCQKTHRPVEIFANQNKTLNDFVEEGQTLEWHVTSAHAPSLTFQPEAGLCSLIDGTATYKHPARCVVAKQGGIPGSMHVYSYLLTWNSPGGDEVKRGADPRAEAQPPAKNSSDPPSPVVHILRVGSCGGCRAVDPLPGGNGFHNPGGASEAAVELECDGSTLKVKQTPKSTADGSSVTWIPQQGIEHWSVQFSAGGCSPALVGSAQQDFCTAGGAGSHPYTATIYRDAGQTVQCSGQGSLEVQ